jgi:Bacterial inner membrane protein
MTDTLQYFFNPAQLFGYAAFVLGVLSFLQKDDRRFKLYMSAECLAYVVHFALLGNPTAVASSVISVARSVLSLYTKAAWVAFVMVALNLTLGWGLVELWWNWLPLLASCIGTLALFLLSGIRMRLVMLLGTGCWLVNNILSGSIGGTALELVILVTNLRTIFTLRQQNTQEAAQTTEAQSAE